MPLKALSRRTRKDHVSALMLILPGLAIAGEGARYRVGSLTHMGAGFMPVVLGALLTLVGVALAATAGPEDFGDPASQPAEWRGWLCILGGIFAFVLFGTYGGLVPATFVAVFVAAMGDRGNTVRDAALLAAALALAGALLFGWGLHLQLPLFTWG